MKRKLPFHTRLKYVIRVLFVLAFFGSVTSFVYHGVTEGEYDFDKLMHALTAVLGFVQTFIPEVVESVTKKKVRFSEAMQCAIVLFIFGAELLGEISSFYDRISWWDNMLHSISGVILAMIGFMLVSSLNKSKRATVVLSPVFVVMFAFFFALGCGALWEIFEYSADRLLGMNMQKFRPPDGVTTLYTRDWRYDNGLIDTMTDLLLDAICAFGVCVVGYLQLKIAGAKEGKRMRIPFTKPIVDIPDEADAEDTEQE